MVLHSRQIWKNVLVGIIFLTIPIIQLGMTYYLSVAFLVFSYSMVAVFKIDNLRRLSNPVIQAGICAFALKALILIFSLADTRSVLIPLREMICFIGIFLISWHIAKSSISEAVITKLCLILLSIITILVIYQTFQLASGKYFGFPVEYFVFNQETLKGADLALEHGTRFRATSFYGEPSYTSWIVVSLLTISLQDSSISLRKGLVLLGLSFCSVAFSQSISGIIAVFMLFAYWFVFSKKKDGAAVLQISIGLLSLALIIALSFYYSKDLSGRFQAILNLSDQSSNVRFQDPIFYINKILTEGQILGIYNYADVKIDNAGLGIFIHYGIMSLIIIFAILKHSKNKLLILYMVLSMNFNGTIFRYDKVLIIGLTIGLGKKFLSESKIASPRSKKTYKTVVLS